MERYAFPSLLLLRAPENIEESFALLCCYLFIRVLHFSSRDVINSVLHFQISSSPFHCDFRSFVSDECDADFFRFLYYVVTHYFYLYNIGRLDKIQSLRGQCPGVKNATMREQEKGGFLVHG